MTKAAPKRTDPDSPFLRVQLHHVVDATPERALVAAVLDAAVADYRRRGRAHDDAAAWLGSDADEPFSFLWTCDVLGLEAETMRRALSRAIAA